MLSRVVVASLLLGVTAGAAFADDCIQVIALSRLDRTTVLDEADLREAARTYCSEYNAGKRRSNSMSLDGAYKKLTAAFGSSGSSEEDVARRVCDSTTATSIKTTLFTEYVQTIAPGAYEAYARCLEFTNSANIRFNLSSATRLATSFSINVVHATNVNSQSATMIVNSSPEIRCRFEQSNDKRVILGPNTSTDLLCTRPSANNPGWVSVSRRDATVGALQLTWGAFTADGLPVDPLNDLLRETRELRQVVEMFMDSAVVAFVADSCPPGWELYEPARGRFIRGIDRAGGVDPDGVRRPGSVQAHAVGQHVHRVPQPGFASAARSGTPGNNGYWNGYRQPQTPSDPNGGPAESRPANVALLYCRAR